MPSFGYGYFNWKTAVLLVAVAASLERGLCEEVPLELRWNPARSQQIKGWGLTPMPMGSGGQLAFHAEASEHIKKAYLESGATVVRLLMGATNLYDNENRRVRKASVESAIVPFIQMASSNGIDDYIISILSPPVYMKQNYSPEAHWNLVPNGLRPEFEMLFAKYVTELIQVIKANELKLPKAISMQSQPNYFPGDSGAPIFATSVGAHYTPAQWCRVARLVRAELDRAGFHEIQLIGPESLGLDWISEVGFSDASQAGTKMSRLEFLSGLCYLPHGSLRRHSQSDLETLTAIQGERDMWMLAANPSQARNDRDLVVEVFRSLCNDLDEVRTSFWFWRYAFRWRESADAMISGRQGKRSAVFSPLADLWRTAVPGSYVHRVETRGTSFDETEAIHTVGLETAQSRIVVVLNTGYAERKFRINIDAVELTLSFYCGNKTWSGSSIANPTHDIELPPKTLLMAVARHAN